MDELENLARRAEQFEQEAKAATKWEEVSEKPEPGKVETVVDIDAAGNRVESVMKVAEAAAKMFLDSRLFLPDEEIQAGRDSLAPVVQKYGLAGEGTGRLPYQEELTAGFYLGGLFKRFRRALVALKAADKAKAEKEREANQQQNKASGTSGEERKHQSKESAQPVSGQVGLGEVTDPDAPGWLSQPGVAGITLGQ